MRKLLLLPASALVVAACSSPPVNVYPEQAPPTISATGTGTVEATPDAARVSLAVRTQADSADQAQSLNAAASQDLREALSEQAVDDADISSTQVSVNPVYDYSKRPAVITSYEAVHSYQVVLYDLETAGEVIDEVVLVVGDPLSVNSTTTFVSDPTAALGKAREVAVDNAKKVAATYAQGLDFELGPVASVSESPASSPLPPVFLESDMATEGRPSTQVAPGTDEVSVTVNVSWFIQ